MTFKAEIVFVRILVPFILGIICAYIFASNKSLLLLVSVNVFLFFVLLVINAFYKKFKAYQFKAVIGILFHFFIFAFGGLICTLHNQSFKTDYFANEDYEYLKVWIANEPEQTNDILRFETNVTQAYVNNKATAKSGKLLLALKLNETKPIKLKYGDELLISAQYLEVEPPYNPAEFDFKAWLASKNIYHQSFVNQDHLIKLGENKGNSIINYALEVRQRQVATYRKLIKNDEAFAVASTLVLGYRSDLSKETLNAYSKTGTIHALSVSGMHVGIIYIFLNWALFFLDKKLLGRILKLVLISSLIWYYSLLTGFSPSVLRSAVMLSVFIIAKSFNRNSNSYNILAFTAICLLIYNPFLVWDVGFQLSFLAVFGLIYLQPKIYSWMYVKNKWLEKLWATVAMSLAAQLATYPLSIYYFHQFPVYFIVANLFILIPLTLMMYLGIAILMLRVYFLAPAFEWIITFTNNGLKWIAELPFSGINSIWITKWQLLALSIILSMLIYSLSKRPNKKLFFASIVLFIAYQFVVLVQKENFSGQQKIIHFTLRKNYATAFIEGNGATLVTDLTKSDKNFEFFVKPALDQLQVSELNFLAMSSDTITESFVKKQNQIVFNNYRILVIDSSLNYKNITNKPSFESVWLHKNPKLKIEQITTEISFKNLVIDASNKDYRIKEFVNDANKKRLNHFVLKKNKAYLVNLK